MRRRAASSRYQRQLVAIMFIVYSPSATASHASDARRAVCHSAEMSTHEKSSASSAMLTASFRTSTA